MTSPLKIGNVVLCEYIVEGLNNKHTLINTYSGDVIVSEMPAQIPIAFYIEMIPVRDFNGPMELTVKLGKAMAVQGQADVELKAGTPTVTTIPMGILKVREPSILRLFLRAEGERSVKVLERKLHLATT